MGHTAESTATDSSIKRTSRATSRVIEAGTLVPCAQCERALRFRARQKDMQVICNVYVDGMWDRVDHFHVECYREAGEPHGPCQS